MQWSALVQCADQFIKKIEIENQKIKFWNIEENKLQLKAGLVSAMERAVQCADQFIKQSKI